MEIAVLMRSFQSVEHIFLIDFTVVAWHVVVRRTLRIRLRHVTLHHTVQANV